MAVIGEPPHPQALFMGFTADDPGFQAMARLVPTARLVSDLGHPLSGLRAAEWDIAVSNGPAVWQIPDHMHVLAFGCQALGTLRAGHPAVTVTYQGQQPSAILRTPETGLGDALRRLIAGDLVPALQAQDARPYLTLSGSLAATRHAPLAVAPDDVPFVTDADGHLIAGALRRAGSGWCWALPHSPRQPELWLAAALADWHDRTPDQVPALPGWRSRQAWRSRDESAAEAALTALRDDRARVIADLERREAALVAAATTATANADRGPRRLLTAQGEPLVHAVAQALRAFGFTVVDVDASDRAPGEPKTEDLQVNDPAKPDWTNITEVKGYTGGAKTGDFQHLARYANIFGRRTGALPTSRWYVVNQFIDADPDTRQAVLPGADYDIALFAEDGGLIIDTRELFRLLRLVEDSAVTPEQAKDTLRHATGVLYLSPP